MSGEVTERIVDIGSRCRIWEKGDGEPVGFLGGLGGVPRWLPFLDRLARTRRVVVLSPPGFPGSEPGHKQFEQYLDWITVTLDLIEGAGLAGADLIGASVGGLLAAEAAALSPATVRRLVLLAPFGTYDVDLPGVDPFAQTLGDLPATMVVDPRRHAEALAPPDGADFEEQVRWAIVQAGASDAAARILWPFGDRGITRRLHRIRQDTLVVWGEQDRVLPVGYARRYARGIAGRVEVVTVPDAGHLLYIDQPEHAADAVDRFLCGTPIPTPARSTS